MRKYSIYVMRNNKIITHVPTTQPKKQNRIGQAIKALIQFSTLTLGTFVLNIIIYLFLGLYKYKPNILELYKNGITLHEPFWDLLNVYTVFLRFTCVDACSSCPFSLCIVYAIVWMCHSLLCPEETFELFPVSCHECDALNILVSLSQRR